MRASIDKDPNELIRIRMRASRPPTASNSVLAFNPETILKDSDIFQVNRVRSAVPLWVRRTACFGASPPLPSVPTKVRLLN